VIDYHDSHWFGSTEWYRALTLVERQALTRDYIATRQGDDTNGLADRAIRRWRAESPFDSDAYYAERVKSVGLTESEFGILLSMSAETLKTAHRNCPPWLDQLSEAFLSHSPTTEDAAAAPDFLKAINPLLNQSRSRLHDEVTKITRARKRPPFDPKTVEDICSKNLVRRLIWMIGRTLVLELNVARLNGLLKGDTPEARFESFIEHLQDPETALALLHEYPVLARQLVICVDQWLTFNLEFLTNLAKDFQAVCDMFMPVGDPGVLTEIMSEAGDRHRNGQSVLIAKFNSGFTVVYKPRSLRTDVHFNELMKWANQRGFQPSFRTLRLLDRGSYGWVEFIEPKDCSSCAEVDRFYRRQGGNLALLYVLGATDFHYENLIASGEYPVLLDLEVLFTQVLIGSAEDPSYQLAADALMNSVLRIGLLPHGTAEELDFCGFGKVEGRLSPINILQWERTATDKMRYVRKSLPMRGGANRPMLAGAYVDMHDQADSITAGFHDMYRLLQDQRQALLSVNGPLAAFAEDEVRVVIRSTLTYSQLLEEIFHPDVLRDAVDRDFLLDRLWIQTSHQPYLAKVIPAEQIALQQCDIPIFTTRPNSRDLWTCSRQHIPEFLNESGLASAMQRVRELDEDNFQRQLWVIQASLATQAVGTRIQENGRNAIGRAHESVREECLRAALEAGTRLEVLAARRKNSASWISVAATGKRQWTLVPLGADLYDGLPGVALFLAYLAAITQESRFTDLAQAALTTLKQLITPTSPSMRNIGGFSGCGGVIYALSHLGVLWNDSELIGRAESVVRVLPDVIDQDDQLDIIGGAAGCILSLLGLYRIAGTKNILDIAIRCGDLLVARATRQEIGAAWSNVTFGSRPLTGFSHGAAGIAYALTVLAAESKQDRFYDMALEAMAYERSLFNPRLGNWPDLREFEDSNHSGDGQSKSSAVAWCHGAAGIGLSRLNMLSRFDDAAIRAEIEASVETTLALGLGDDLSLCHGALGNLEFLLEAAHTLSRPDILISANSLKLNILESRARKVWICGLPLNVESPGLMTGLAGIGYGLLRLAEPSRIPSVLLLAPPPCCSH
jgi:type 2 lantibiotic biosynthesis protein LanM